jgi:hypothetical protein
VASATDLHGHGWMTSASVTTTVTADVRGCPRCTTTACGPSAMGSNLDRAQI